MKVTEKMIEVLKELGANEWHKGNHNRLYLNEAVDALIGLETECYKSGNIKSAWLKGEPISNAEAGRIIERTCKAYVDLDTMELVTINELLMTAVEEKEAEIAAVEEVEEEVEKNEAAVEETAEEPVEEPVAAAETTETDDIMEYLLNPPEPPPMTQAEKEEYEFDQDVSMYVGLSFTIDEWAEDRMIAFQHDLKARGKDQEYWDKIVAEARKRWEISLE